MIIKGVGHYVPPQVLTNKDLEEDAPTNDKWTREVLGIKERRIASLGETPSFMATKASRKAMMMANLNPWDVDMIIVGVTQPDRVAPSTGSIIKNLLGAYNAVAFDVNAVCSGYMFAQDIALKYKDTYRHILVIGVDAFSNITDYGDRDCAFFGDGAGAVVLESKNGGFTHSYIQGHGEDVFGFTCHHEETFRMNGRSVYKTATEMVPQIINYTLAQAGLLPEEIDYVIPHQPSTVVLQSIAESVDIPYKKFLGNRDKYGNTAAASIPLLLSDKWKKFKSGDRLLMVSIGAGWTLSTAIYEMP